MTLVDQAYLNTAVNMVYDKPDRGWCVNDLRIATDSLGIFHMIYTPAFNKHIFQHRRRPSDALK